MKKVFLLLFISLTCFSQAKISYKKSDGLLDITPYISYMADSSEKLTFEQVRALPASAFTANNKVGLNLGNTEFPYWFRIDFEKNTFNEDLYVFIESPEIRILDAYSVDENGNINKLFTGSRRPFTSRYLTALNYIIKVPPKYTALYYKISTKSMFLPTYLGTVKTVFKYSHLLDGLYYALIGLMFALFFYNLFLFFSLKDKVFLYYSVFVLFSLLNMAKAEGMFHELLWFDEPFLILNENNNFSTYLVCFSIYFFTTTFLNTKLITPTLHKVLKAFFIYFLILLIFEFLPYRGWINDLSQLSTITYGILVLFAGFYIWWLGYEPAKYFAIAWTFYIIGIIIILLSIIGFLPMYGIFWMNSWKIGQIIEALLMAFAVAYRFNLFRQEARDAQALVLQRSGENEQLLLAHNQILEEKLQLEEKINHQKPDIKVDDLLERLQSERGKNKKLAVSTIEGVLLLPIPDIIRLEALGSYCNIYLTNYKKIIASKNLAEFEPMLDKNDFLRIHKSHIVNINFVERYIRGEGGMVIMPDGAEVSVSRTMKAELLEKLNIS